MYLHALTLVARSYALLCFIYMLGSILLPAWRSWSAFLLFFVSGDRDRRPLDGEGVWCLLRETWGRWVFSVGWEKRRENAALFAQESGLGCISCCCSLESSQGYTWLWERQALQQMTFTCIIILSRASYRKLCLGTAATYPLMENSMIQHFWHNYVVCFSVQGLPHIILDT